VNRRAFVTGLGAVLAAPLAAEAQQTVRVARVGVLFDGQPSSPDQIARSPLTQGLRDLGWVPGETIIIERVYSESQPGRLAELAAELVRRRVDVIWCNAPTSAVAAARATTTIPIVFWGVALPVELGLVESLGRPGRNVTGFAFSAGPEIITKHLQLLKAIAPNTRRLARLSSRPSIEHVDGRRITPPIAESPYAVHSMEGHRFFLDDHDNVEAVFASIREWQPDAIYAFGDPATFSERRRIVDFANRHRLPSAFGMKDFVAIGGLFSYGPDTADTVRRSALYIDRILKGAKPSELPVEQPTKFELVINLKTAKALGLTILPSVLLRADQVIE